MTMEAATTEALRLAREALADYPYDDAHWCDKCAPVISAIDALPSAPSGEPAAVDYFRVQDIADDRGMSYKELSAAIRDYVQGAAPLLSNGLTPRDDYEDGDSFAGMDAPPQAATASVAGLVSPRDDYEDGDSFAGMGAAPQAVPAPAPVPSEPTDAQVAMLDPWMRPAAARELLRKVLASTSAAAAPEPVARVVSWTNGSYWRNYKVEWLRDVEAGALLYAHPAPAVAEPTAVPLTDALLADAEAAWFAGPAFNGNAGFDARMRDVAEVFAAAWGITLADPKERQ